MSVRVPPSPSVSQVPEYARRFEELKMQVRKGRGSRYSNSAGQGQRNRAGTASCNPTPAVKPARVRLPRKRAEQKPKRESTPERNWIVRTAGVALVASLVVSVLVNLVMIGMDGGHFAHGVINAEALLSKTGWLS